MARARWFVIQVLSGRERRVSQLVEAACHDTCDSSGKPLLEEIFSPHYVTRRKYQGEWIDVERDLLPGYVIAVTADPIALKRQLREVNTLTKLLTMGGAFVPLQEGEREWLEEATKPQDRVVPLSIAVKNGDIITVTEGPLKGNEAMITRINRHKCLATLELQVGGKRITTRVGLAVLTAEEKPSPEA